MKSFRLKAGAHRVFPTHMFFIIIPLVIIFVIIYISFIITEQNKFNDAMSTNTKSIAAGIDRLISSIDSTSLKVAMLPSINKTLNLNGGINIADYYQIKEDVNFYSEYNELFQSFYLYNSVNDKVLSTNETLFQRESFYDKALLDEVLARMEEIKWNEGRKIGKSYLYPESSRVLTFVRNLPVASKKRSGALILNVKEEAFMEAVKGLGKELEDILIINPEGTIISSLDKVLIDRNIQYLGGDASELKAGSGMLKVKKNNTPYYLFYQKSEVTEWVYGNLLTAVKFENFIKKQRQNILIAFAGSLCLLLFFGYYFSVNVRQGLKKLLLKFDGQIQNLIAEDGSTDEYQLLGNAIEKIVADNTHIGNIILEYNPIIREKLISDILLGIVTSEDELEKRQGYLGIKWEHPCFMVGIAAVIGLEEMEDQRLKWDIRLYTKSIIEQVFGKYYSIYGVILDEEKLGFILNYKKADVEMLKDSIKEICSEINTILKEKVKAAAFFSFGHEYGFLLQSATSYAIARKNLDFKSVSDAPWILFETDVDNENPIYPIQLHNQIVNGIKMNDRHRVAEAVSGFFDEFVNRSQYSLENTKSLVTILFSSIIGELWKEDIFIGSEKGLQLVNTISICDNPGKLRKCMTEMTLEIIGKQERAIGDKENEATYISKVVHYILQNYNRDISVDDIASCVSLNPRYLGKIFKSATGKTLVEYLNGVRIKKAKELMEKSEAPLKDISIEVGYNDIHSFIRFFKKYEGVTPGDYRRTL